MTHNEDRGEAEDDLSDSIALLMDEDEEVRYDAARRLQSVGRPALRSAIELAKDSRARMREMAAYVLGQICDDFDEPGLYRCSYCREGVPVLLELLTDPDAAVRASAAAALGFQKVVESLPALWSAASDPSEEVRFYVATALGSFYSGMWTERGADKYREPTMQALLRLMDDADDDVRDWATFGVHQGGHDAPESRARLWRALDDPNADVRGEAAEGLALFGDRAMVPRLKQLLMEDEAISPCYILAAIELADPELLPAVENAASRWDYSDRGKYFTGLINDFREAIGLPRTESGNEPPETVK